MPGDKQSPEVTVKIKGNTAIATDSGEKLETRGGPGILSVTVDLRLDNPDMFSVEYDMMKLEKPNLLDAFEAGTEVEIQLGLAESGVLCKGEICYIEPSFDVEEGYRTTISGYHKLHRLTRGQRSKTWGEGLKPDVVPTTPASDVINDSKAHVGGKSDSLSMGEVGSTDLKLEYVPQLNMSDFEFLRALGANLEFKADPDQAAQVKFSKVDPSKGPVMSLARDRADATAGEDSLILHTQFRLSTVQQYAAVEVRGWDPVKKKNIVAKVTSSTYMFDGTKGWEVAGTALYKSGSTGRKYVVMDQPVSSQAEAKALAQSLFDQFSMDFLTGEAVVKGNPKLLPGETIEFTGFGKAYSGKYLITAATHTYRPDEGYRTTIAFSRNSKGA
ncbi:MAG: phage late control D family protein [Myxococcales bacterium]|nr:phage late control D family protein [Myxococcales bacterium]